MGSVVRGKLLGSRRASLLPAVIVVSGDIDFDGAIDAFEDDDLAGRDGGDDIDDDDREELHDVLLLITKYLPGSSVFSCCSAFTLNLE